MLLHEHHLLLGSEIAARQLIQIDATRYDTPRFVTTVPFDRVNTRLLIVIDQRYDTLSHHVEDADLHVRVLGQLVRYVSRRVEWVRPVLM